MAKCLVYNLSPSYCYKRHKCRCNICLSWKRDAAQRTNNMGLARERSRVWRLNNLERSRNNSKDYQKRHPEKPLQWQLKKYGLTLGDYYNLCKEQGNRCAICGSDVGGMHRGKTRLCVDHDPSTGEIRGLLCGYCNIGLGNFKHSTKSLNKAIQYLEGDVY